MQVLHELRVLEILLWFEGCLKFKLRDLLLSTLEGFTRALIAAL